MNRTFLAFGLACGVSLTAYDIVTTHCCMKSIMPQNSTSPILTTAPLLFAILTVTFNGLSGQILHFHGTGQLETRTGQVVLGWWLLFVGLDLGTSFAGMVSQFSSKGLSSVAAILQAFFELSSEQRLTAAVLAAAACSGPLLSCVFSRWLYKDLKPVDSQATSKGKQYKSHSKS